MPQFNCKKERAELDEETVQQLQSSLASMSGLARDMRNVPEMKALQMFIMAFIHFTAIREKLWERVVTEVEMMPNHEALKLHWMRCCWVFDYWSQSTSNTHTLSDLSKCGWQITDNRLEIVWDTVFNFQKVEKTVEWYTKGCECKTGCKTNRCKCRKAQNENFDGFCGPGCKCVNCFNVPGSGDQVLDVSIDLDDVIPDETEDFEVPVDVEQPELDGLVEELDQTDDYWLFSNEEI
ncbi:unnamed protein product [Mytilus coruscus]|uniref:Tesmin/TSO1-like CXC domain-containing protein n=1 Tax=Mytilus coruscus TaxID=42192 RepID=A0A6J8A536_MYTCO|nr:unnamed protein product [Mytilus coruscus]